MFSATCQILAKRTMDMAEKYNLLALEQYSSRKNHSALQQAINMRLCMDLSLLTRRPLSIAAIDLCSCYDRIQHCIAGMAMRKYGHKTPPIMCRFTTRQEIEVSLRTGFGDSELRKPKDLYLIPIDARGNPISVAIQGVGQGSPDSSDGPVLWAIVSTAVLDVMRNLGYGITIKCTRSGESLNTLGCLFVDDSTYFQQSPTHSVPVVVERTQLAITDLQGLIKATGGAFNPLQEKSYWWLMSYNWNNGKSHLMTKPAFPAELQTQDTFDEHCLLHRREVDCAKVILGVAQAPKNDGKAMTKHLRDKATNWTKSTQGSKLSKQAVCVAITSTIPKSLKWPLAACTLTDAQIKHVYATRNQQHQISTTQTLK
mmetsp:Transcript_5090/g.7785  ORF Transcript_5090/g.7785 Transcript_5090/m.7785 type:complete len:370 (-) Transcript_5090:162-1271(-)